MEKMTSTPRSDITILLNAFSAPRRFHRHFFPQFLLNDELLSRSRRWLRLRKLREKARALLRQDNAQALAEIDVSGVLKYTVKPG